MSLKKIKDYILNDERDLSDRLFVLISAVLLVSLCITLAEIIITGAALFDILALSAGILLIFFVTVISIRLDRIRAGAVIISFGVCLVFSPVTFLLGGGINGDGPLWFLFGIFFLNICLKGKLRTRPSQAVRISLSS